MQISMDLPERQEVLVVGHLNPDTDSICSAIAYAELKKIIDEIPEGTVYSITMEVVLTNEQDQRKSK